MAAWSRWVSASNSGITSAGEVSRFGSGPLIDALTSIDQVVLMPLSSRLRFS